MRALLLSVLVGIVTRPVQGDADIGLCCLCNDCGAAVNGRGSMFITQEGFTCDSMALWMADSRNACQGSPTCKTYKSKYRQMCCDRTFTPIPVAQPDPGEEVVNLPDGGEPHCDLCTRGTYPGRPNTVTAVLYIPGNPTCKDLYWMGRTGNIADHLCNPLVDYFQEPCGCDSYDPNKGDNGGDNSGAYRPPVRKIPPADTKKKLYKGRVRGSARILKGS